MGETSRPKSWWRIWGNRLLKLLEPRKRPPAKVINYAVYHEQVIVVSGFIGGITFAGLVFILQSASFAHIAESSGAVIAFMKPFEPREYVSGLEVLLGGISFLCTFICIICAYIRSEQIEPEGQKKLYEFVDWCFTFAFVGFMIAIASIIFPFSPAGTGVLIGFAVAVTIIFGVIYAWARSLSPPPSTASAPDHLT